MIFRKPRTDEIGLFDAHASHPLQTYAWGEFRATTGVKVRRLLGFDGSDPVVSLQATFHAIPHTSYTIGYLPKGPWPDDVQLAALRELCKEEKALFIKLEPNVSMPPYSQADIDGIREYLVENGCEIGRSLFTPHTFVMDITADEDVLLANMKRKTRYNVRLAERNGVQISVDSSSEAFEDYLRLLELTTSRQQFYSHDEAYHRNMWEILHKNQQAHILKAEYKGDVVAAFILFMHNNTLYYPYGASSRTHREMMASNLLMWEAIRFGKKNGCTHFDMWGSLGPDPDTNDPWYGFHRFKEGYGGVLTTFVGTYDLVIDPRLYKMYRWADYWRWKWLRLRAKLPF